MAGKKKVSLLDFQWELVKQLCWAPDADVEDDDEEGDEDQEEVVVVPAAPRIDPASRLVGGHKVHKMTIFPATRKANPQRPCLQEDEGCQKRHQILLQGFQRASLQGVLLR